MPGGRVKPQANANAYANMTPKQKASVNANIAISAAKITLYSNAAAAKKAKEAADAAVKEANSILAGYISVRNQYAVGTLSYNTAQALVVAQKTKILGLKEAQKTAQTKFETTAAAVAKVIGFADGGPDAARAKAAAAAAALSKNKKKIAPANPTGVHVYNAPMVFGNNLHGLQGDVMDPEFILPGNYGDAKTAWTDATPSGRGAFQMDRQTDTAEAVANAAKDSITSSQIALDTTKYGFKFLYNPNTVQMSWGAVMAMDPVFEASGKDPFIPGTSNLTASNIDFSLVLNRIQDFTYLDANGLKAGLPSNTPISNSPDAVYDATHGVFSNPYGSFNLKPGVSVNQELAKIYEKGTMYDLEYLFKTMHGNGAFVAYESVLQGGVTADPGWLPVRPIELHLGNKLRYRVRIQSLSVSHTIFNARMVPILSTVTISCARYWDGPLHGNKALKF